MALTATMYSLAVQLSDSDRGVYETLDLRVARQPSETAEYMVMRILAYCLEYTAGIEFTGGVASGDEPAVLVRDLTGRITDWIEVGMPAAARLHKGSKLADRAAVYTHRELRQVLSQLQGEKIHRASEIPIISFERGFIEELASRLDRRTALALTVTGRHLYVDAGGHAMSSGILEQNLA
jgi:uncharacterized protein YaeQ